MFVCRRRRPSSASPRPSCLFQDSTGSSKFNPNAFFPMVLSERVAWPEYMGLVRAALAKQAEAIIKQGAALEAGSSGGREGGTGESGDDSAGQNESSRPASPGLNPAGGGGGEQRHRPDRNDQERQPRAAVDRGSVGAGSRSNAPSRSPGSSGATAAPVAAPANLLYGTESSSLSLSSSPLNAQLSGGHPAEIRQLTLGKVLRGTTAAGPESWALFRFDLQAAGPIITVVLDIVDGDPDIVVSKGGLPSPGLHATSSGAAAPAEGAPVPIRTAGKEPRDPWGAVVPVPPPAGGDGGTNVGVGRWRASSAHRGLRVVKIFPRDPRLVARWSASCSPSRPIYSRSIASSPASRLKLKVEVGIRERAPEVILPVLAASA